MSLEVNISEPDEFNCQELHSSIEKVANNKGYNDFEYKVDGLGGKGGNFTANVFRVLIKKTDSDDYNFSVIVKTLVNAERQYLFHELHKREVVAYTEIINKFISLQNALKEHERLVLPECLLVNIEHKSEVIILDDLQNQGFELDDKQIKYDHTNYTHLSSVVSELAKFHALSYIFQKQEPKVFDDISSKFQDILFQNNFLNKSKLRNYFFDSFDIFLKHVKNGEAKNKLSKVRDKLLELLQDYTKPTKTNVLCHGDCWANNMLFKNENNHQGKVCFIDYQTMRYANPMTDFMFLIFLSTDSLFRTEHFDNLKNTYYNSLTSFLNLFDVDVTSVYAKSNFDSDLEEFLPYGLLVAIIELRIVTMSLEEDASLKETKSSSHWDLSATPNESVLFKYRVNDVVEEAIENGVLDKLLAKLKTEAP